MVLVIRITNRYQGGSQTIIVVRGVSSVWLRAIQEKWPYSQWEAELLLQGVWPAICLRREQPRSGRRTTDPGRTLALRENLSTWHLPCGGRQYPVAHALYRQLLCHVA